MFPLIRPIAKAATWSAIQWNHLTGSDIPCWNCGTVSRVRPPSVNHVPVCPCGARLGCTVLLLDVSESMADFAGGGRRRIDVLREAVHWLLPQVRQVRLIAFSAIAGEIRSAASLPEPFGGTATHLGLTLAASLHPRRTVLISDGVTDDVAATVDAARRLPGTLDVIFCGNDHDRAAIEFLHRLARMKNGEVKYSDLHETPQGRNPLLPPLRKMLMIG